MRHGDTQDPFKPGVGLVAVGATLFAASATCAFATADHMAVAAAVCGPVARHCILCIASSGSLLASAGIIAAGVILLGDRPAPQSAGPTASLRHRMPLLRG